MAVAGFQFDELSHTYTENGIVIPSVTQILEEQGLIDYAGVLPRVLEHKRRIGTALHKAAHYLDEDDLDLDSVHKEVRPYLDGYIAFKADTGFKPRLIEYRTIACVRGMKFAMTVDREGLIADVPWVIELKATADVEPSWPQQLSGYDLGLPPAKEGKRRKAALQCKPDGTYKVHMKDRDTGTDYDDPVHEEVFLAALFLATWKRRKR